MTGRRSPRWPIRDDQCGKNLAVSRNYFPNSYGMVFAREPGPMERGDCGRHRTAGRIERGGGNGDEPVRSPQGLRNQLQTAAVTRMIFPVADWVPVTLKVPVWVSIWAALQRVVELPRILYLNSP